MTSKSKHDGDAPDYSKRLVEDVPGESAKQKLARHVSELEMLRVTEYRLLSTASVYEQLDRLITEADVEIAIVDGELDQPMSWNDGVLISFNRSRVEDASLLDLHGVNFHELAHLLFSPRAGSALGKWVKETDRGLAFNILEDQRIERLLIATYPSTKPYLEAAVLRHILNSGDNSQSWPVIYGRNYLDKDLRLGLGYLYISQHGASKDNARRIAHVIDAYCGLEFPKDNDLAMSLIREFEMSTGMFGNVNIPASTCADRPMLTKGKIRKQVRALNKDFDNNMKDATIDDIIAELAGVSYDGYYEGEGVEEVASGKYFQITADETICKELNEVGRAINESTSTVYELENAEFSDVRTSQESLVAASNFGEEMRDVVTANGPHWAKRKSSGKVNVNRAMAGGINNLTELFDQWRKGSDICDIEAAIAVDHSGSMGSRMNKALESVWVIKRGLELIDASVTVLTFNGASHKLYGAEDLAEHNSMRSIHAIGLTNPRKALESIEDIMAKSDKATKMVFVVTDGLWASPEFSDQSMIRLADSGVITVLVHIGQISPSANPDVWSHHATIFKTIDDVGALVDVAREVIISHLTNEGRL